MPIPLINKRHGGQRVLSDDQGGVVTIDLDDINGLGKAVDNAFVHYIGGIYPAGTVGFVDLVHGSLAVPVANTPTRVALGGANFNLSAYFWVITALGANGETLQSNEVTFTPIAATDTITITWAAVAGATGYKIYRSEATGNYTSPALLVTITDGSTLTFDDIDGSAEGAGTPDFKRISNSIRRAVLPLPSPNGWIQAI